MSTEPSQPTTGAVTDTTTDNLVPPGAEAYGPQAPDVDPLFDLTRLAAYLAEAFPEEVARTNRQIPEGPVDTAIRLLQALSASAPPDTLPRCPEPYCNRPQGHDGEHGWVHHG